MGAAYLVHRLSSGSRGQGDAGSNLSPLLAPPLLGGARSNSARPARCSSFHGAHTVHGFTYLALLFGIAITGLALASVGVVWHTSAQREKERELLFVGEQFRSAITQYLASSPGAGRYPARLEDLLLDPRYPNVRRYLRRLYRDPMTGGTQWGLVKSGDGGIAGVYSLGMGRPIKSDGFAPEQTEFAGAESYAQWRFMAAPPAGRQAARTAPVSAAMPVTQSDASVQVDPSADNLAQACALVRATDVRQCQQLGVDVAQRGTCLSSAEERFRACAQGLPSPPLRREIQ